MGGEQTRKWELFLFYVAGSLILLVGIVACRHMSAEYTAPDPMAKIRQSLSKGDFEAALSDAQSLLGNSSEIHRDELLYLTGMIYAHPDNPKSDREKSTQRFLMLLHEYPSSRWAQSAKIWISLFEKIRMLQKHTAQLRAEVSEKQKEVDSLKTQIEELKKIDLGIEEKKRNNLPR